MKILVNTRLLLDNKLEGIGWFSFETLSRLVKLRSNDTFYFVFDRKYAKKFIFADNVIPIIIPPQSRHPILWFLWFHISLPLLIKKIKPDLVFSPEAYIPLKSKVKTINVIHDIAFEEFPESVPKLVLLYYKYFFKRYAHCSDLIFTVSEFSKKDIIERYNITPSKIKVLYNGVNKTFSPLNEQDKNKAKYKFASGRPYFSFIGALYERKNLKRLMLAFDAFKEKTQYDACLVISGAPKNGYNELIELKESLKHGVDIIFTGRLEHTDDVNLLLGGSLALCYVSLTEGFGIPCIEAMQAETVVITSNKGALPEVCGDAAIFVDPLNIESIAYALELVYNSEELRLNYIDKGKIQREKYNWDTTAKTLNQYIEELL